MSSNLAFQVIQATRIGCRRTVVLIWVWKQYLTFNRNGLQMLSNAFVQYQSCISVKLPNIWSVQYWWRDQTAGLNTFLPKNQPSEPEEFFFVLFKFGQRAVNGITQQGWMVVTNRRLSMLTGELFFDLRREYFCPPSEFLERWERNNASF